MKSENLTNFFNYLPTYVRNFHDSHLGITFCWTKTQGKPSYDTVIKNLHDQHVQLDIGLDVYYYKVRSKSIFSDGFGYLKLVFWVPRNQTEKWAEHNLSVKIFFNIFS